MIKQSDFKIYNNCLIADNVAFETNKLFIPFDPSGNPTNSSERRADTLVNQVP